MTESLLNVVVTAASLEEPPISLNDDLLSVVSTYQAWVPTPVPLEGTPSKALEPVIPLDEWIRTPAALGLRDDAVQTKAPALGSAQDRSSEPPDFRKPTDLVLTAASFEEAPITLGDEPGPRATEPLAWRQGNSVPARVDPPAASRIELEQDVRGHSR